MHDMINAIKAANTKKKWRFEKSATIDGISIKTKGQEACVVCCLDDYAVLAIPKNVVKHRFEPYDGTKSATHGIPQRWIWVSRTDRLSLQKNNAYWTHVFTPDVYQSRKTPLLQLVAIAQAEVLHTLEDAKLLLHAHKKARCA